MAASICDGANLNKSEASIRKAINSAPVMFSLSFLANPNMKNQRSPRLVATRVAHPRFFRVPRDRRVS